HCRIPVIRVSVDHGTGFDLAGKGESNELSLVNSIDYATKLAVNKNSGRKCDGKAVDHSR
ncbi:4-hydroxythreonine-4-phosphate dehydrogenase PdxA, partial [Moraxella bovoculi]|uniref:4-hydroxythreonine-4-phosphate dehydrogenase PdxA n=1 Tax=Moraxella bovoculi TaxID=386891 RepID=UPI0016569B60